MAALDKNGEELQVGDEVVVRARIKEIHQIGAGENADSIIKVTWDSEQVIPLLDYLKPGAVEKC